MAHAEVTRQGVAVVVAAAREQAERIWRCVAEAQRRGCVTPRGVHRMRVASRRLRAVIEVLEASGDGGVSGWRKPVRRLTRALGRVRAADVSVELLVEAAAALGIGPRVRPLMRHLRAERRRAAAAAAETLRGRGLARALERLVSLPRQATARALEQAQRAVVAPERRRWRVVLARRAARVAAAQRRVSLAASGAAPQAKTDLHALRIAVKRWRYVLEIAARDQPARYEVRIGRLRRWQELLGALHDWEVARREVETFLSSGARLTAAQETALRRLMAAAASRERRLRRQAMRLPRAERAWNIRRDGSDVEKRT